MEVQSLCRTAESRQDEESLSLSGESDGEGMA